MIAIIFLLPANTLGAENITQINKIKILLKHLVTIELPSSFWSNSNSLPSLSIFLTIYLIEQIILI